MPADGESAPPDRAVPQDTAVPERPPAQFEQLVDEERRQYAEDSREEVSEIEALLGYIDEDLRGAVRAIPVTGDPLVLMQYVAGIVETKRTASDLRDRSALIDKVMIFTVAWIAVVLILVVFAGFSILGFALSEKVLIALLSTTTANVLGLAVIVLKGMFGHPQPDHLKNEKRRDKPGDSRDDRTNS